MSLSFICIVLALICFLLDVARVNAKISLTPLGLALFMASFLVGDLTV